MEKFKDTVIHKKDKIVYILSRAWKRIASVRLKGSDVLVTVIITILSCLIIVPSIVQCAENREKAACEKHMYRMLTVINDALMRETEEGGIYWQSLIMDGNYQKLLSSANDKTGESGKYPASDYYIRAGEEKLSIICKRHKDISEKEINLTAIHNADVSAVEKPMIDEKIAFLVVSGPDTYYVGDSLDEVYNNKMHFRGREVDDVIQNLRVTAVYIGGAAEELPRGHYTVTASELDMSKAGQTELIIKSNPTSIWDNSSYAPFVIDVIGEDDMAPLIVDGGINGRYELAQWDWSDFVSEAATMPDGEMFGASIIRYNGKYYYYPDGLRIINTNDNTNPFDYALDADDETQPAYYIEFDQDSVILNSFDEKKIHAGSLKVENGLIYIWQDDASKELPEGWIRVYCELNKY